MSRVCTHLRWLSYIAHPPLRTHGFRFASTAATAHESISPTILARARATSNEYKSLSQKVAQEYDAKSAKRLSELSRVTNALQRWETAQESLGELIGLIRDPSADEELRELAKADFDNAEAQVKEFAHNLTLVLVPRHPFEDLPCLMEIRPGIGGSEAALFAGDLLRMYQSFCMRHGLRTSILKYEDSAGYSDPKGLDAPLQEAVLEIDSKGAYGILRSEAGIHRVQRVPATESKGRTHTSAASILVLPSFPEAESSDSGEIDFDDPKSDYYIKPEDVRTDIMRARGAGGQHVNTTDSAVRLTHIPTSTVVSIQDSRSQHKNRAKAWQLLRAQLAQARREAREEEMIKLRRSVVGVAKTGRGDKVRTYNYGQQRVTDHRSGVSVHNLDDVMQGGLNLEKIMSSVRLWFQERDVAGILTEDNDSVLSRAKGRESSSP